jgi:hypothetical protein
LKAKDLPSAQLANFTRTTIFLFWTFVENKGVDAWSIGEAFRNGLGVVLRRFGGGFSVGG